MKISSDHVLTTHTGSLPRPDDLIRAMFAKEEGVPVDRAALAERFVVPRKPGNSGGGKGPQFKTDAGRSEGQIGRAHV